METEPCTDCGRPTVRPYEYSKLPKPRTVRRRVPSTGQCEPCRRSPTGPKRVPLELVLVDWNWLHETGYLHEDDTLADRMRLAAPRIGMTVYALNNALHRAGIRQGAA